MARALTVGSRGIVLLARRVGDDIHGPADDQVAGSAESGRDRTVANGFPELLHELLRDRGAFQILLRSIELGQTELRTGLGNEDLVLSHVSSGSVVLGMTDTPRVIWHTKAVWNVSDSDIGQNTR